MKKIIILLLFPFILNACALCALGVPKVYSKVAFEVAKDDKHTLHVTWGFSSDFTKQLLSGYDKNLNNILDEAELVEIHDILHTYLQDRNYLTTISSFIDDTNTLSKNLQFRVLNEEFFLKDGQLFFLFDLSLDVKLELNRVIKIIFEDLDGFFDFMVSETEQIHLENGDWLVPNANFNFIFYKVTSSPKKASAKKSLSQLIPKEQSKKSSYLQALETTLTTFTQKIKELLVSQNSFWKFFWLLTFSFLYGFFHALGPGHGKSLVGSYFLAHGGRYKSALILSLQIGVIHVLGAFLLVLTSVYLIETFISKLLKDVSLYTSYISAVIIILIALWLLYQKIYELQNSHDHSKHGCSCSTCKNIKTFRWSIEPQNSSTCKPQNAKSFALALAAGIVPCPGTVVIFLSTFVLGDYLIGTLSAIAMALGMSVVIFVSAIFGQYLNAKVSQNFSLVPKIFEFLALFIMLTLGVLLFLFPVSL